MCSLPPEVSNYSKALMISSFFHDGVFDKGGLPYIEHPIRVALRLQFDDEKAIAIMHDLVEDTAVTLDDLKDMSRWGFAGFEFPQYIIDAIDGVTRRVYENGTKETYDDFIARCCLNDLSRKVKKADIADNTDPKRLSYLTAKFRKKLEIKYAKALHYIEQYEKENN